MARPKATTKAAAVEAAKTATTKDDLDKIARDAGLKNRKPLERWVAKAKRVESRDDEEETVEAPVEEVRAAADGEMVLSILKAANTFTVNSCAMAVGVDLNAFPKLAAITSLSADEEKTIKSFAPALMPAMEQMLRWLEGHGAAVFGGLFLMVTVPRVVMLGKIAKKLHELESAQDEVRSRREEGPKRTVPTNRTSAPHPDEVHVPALNPVSTERPPDVIAPPPPPPIIVVPSGNPT